MWVNKPYIDPMEYEKGLVGIFWDTDRFQMGDKKTATKVQVKSSLCVRKMRWICIHNI